MFNRIKTPKNNIARDLISLILIFSFTIILILVSNSYSEEFRMANHEILVENIYKKKALVSIFRYENKQLELDFLKYKHVRFRQEYKFIYQDINEQISKLKKLIEVLRHGGTYKYHFEQNSPREEKITYNAAFACKCYNITQLETILTEISAMNTKIGDILISDDIDKKSGEFNRLIKQSEASFIRILEIIDNVSLQIHKKLEQQEIDELHEFDNFIFYKNLFVLIVILLALFLSYKVYKSIKKITEQLNKEISDNNIFTQVIRQSPISIVITDTEGNIEFVNDFFTAQTGYSKAEAIGQNPKVLKSGVLPDKFYDNLWQTIKRGDVWKGEFCNQTKEGVIYWEAAIISPLLNDKGEIIKYIAVKDNITEKKKLKNSLRESSQVLETVMNNLPVGIMIFNKNKKIISLNFEASRILQYDSIEEANANLINQVCHNCVTNTKEGHCPIYDLGQKSYSLKERVLRGKKSEISVLKSAIPVKINGEEVLLEAFMDISIQKLARIKEKEANIAKSEFLANMSHELRTPLNGIIGSVEILKGLELSEEQNQIFSIIQASGENLLNIINDILDFSKIEANKITIEKISFNLVYLLEQVIKQFSYKSRDLGVELLYYVEKDVPDFIIADKVKITQILVNLIGNAFKFTKQGEIIVMVEKKSLKENELELYFSIEDSGIGIPKDKLDDIFEAFSQADTSTTRKFGGTGLGTTISKSFVEKMGGKIGVYSPNKRYEKENKGSVFYFTIMVGVDIQTSVDSAVLDSSINMALIGKKSVGIDLFTKKLEDTGISYKIFSQNEEALESIKKNSFTHILIESTSGTNLSITEYIDKIDSKAEILMLSSLRVTKDNIQTNKLSDILYNPIIFSDFLKKIKPRELEDIRENIEEDKILFSLKILLVEDNIFNQKVGSKLLTQLGCKVDIAENGEVGVEMAFKKTYDIIFMDVQMPVMNGLDATVELREKGCKIPVIAMTANATVKDREICLGSGMNNFLSKPIRKDELLEILTQYEGEKACRI